MKMPEPEIKEAKFGGYDAYTHAQMQKYGRDLLEEALSEKIAEHAGRQWWAKTRHTNGPLHLEQYASEAIMKEVHETARIVIEAAVKKLKETL